MAVTNIKSNQENVKLSTSVLDRTTIKMTNGEDITSSEITLSKFQDFTRLDGWAILKTTPSANTHIGTFNGYSFVRNIGITMYDTTNYVHQSAVLTTDGRLVLRNPINTKINATLTLHTVF